MFLPIVLFVVVPNSSIFSDHRTIERNDKTPNRRIQHSEKYDSSKDIILQNDQTETALKFIPSEYAFDNPLNTALSSISETRLEDELYNLPSVKFYYIRWGIYFSLWPIGFLILYILYNREFYCSLLDIHDS
ncbi:hypothetical protein AB6A40_010348 [Gnathostoma spinigerum]|uniref:Uncharacterized protein n=1 Tax=Gnathostoma spinigerum TaxID=75299 RepID=A0ABD6EUJ4_9BILA